jgi:AAA15 family ATPase/GTPase
MIIELNGNKYDLKKASSGMKSVVSLTLNNLNSKETEGKVIIIDEIENFLHPEWIELAGFLINIFFLKNVIIIVSHRPLLLSLLLKKNPELLSRVERDNEKKYGNIIT